MNKTLCVIPARGGSKGIPQKNMVPLNGRPLLYYALTEALKSRKADRVIVSSDNNEILEFARSFGISIAQPRPPELAQDNTPSMPVLQYTLKACEKEDGCHYDHIVLVQATNPLVLASDIDQVIGKLKQPEVDSCFTVVSLDHFHPSKLKKLEGDRLSPYVDEEPDFIPRQKLDKVYIRNGSCYGVNRPVLLSGSMTGKEIRAVLVPKERFIDINDDIDMQIAGFLLSRISP